MNSIQASRLWVHHSLITALFFSFIVLAPLQQVAASIVINEIVASNGSYYPDEDGDFEDWIELYNAGEVPRSLAGYGLSDDYNRPFRWTFPEITLEPGEFLVIFASGKDRITGAHLHTDFGISSSGEEILLTAPDGTRIDEVPPIAIPRDISYGRQPDGGDEFFFFGTPTPGTANITTAYLGITAPPEFSHYGGFYNESFSLEITSSNNEAYVYYTLDGSEPDQNLVNEIVEIEYGENLIINGSFEEPLAQSVVWPGYFHREEPPLAVPGWNFTNRYGLNNNLSGPNESNQRNPFHGQGRPIPDGNQVLFQQGNDLKTASQTISGLEDGKIYEVSFYFGTRPGYAGMDMWVTFGNLELHPIARYNIQGAYEHRAYWVAYDSEIVGTPELTFHSSYAPGGDVTILYDHVQVREVLSEVEIPDGEYFIQTEQPVTAYAYKNSYPENPGTPFGPMLYRPYQTYEFTEPIQIQNRTQESNQLSAINARWTSQPQLPSGPVFKGTSVRARAIQPGYLPSRVITHTYFVHPDIQNRFGQDIISIVTDEKNLFGYEEGIYVAGKRFDDWRTANPNNTSDWWLNGNYYGRGRAWERPAHVELFAQGTGELLFSQNLGLRIHGGSSRIRTPKSLRLYARNAYDDTDVMEFPFFDGATTKHDNTPLNTFSRVNLRTGGHAQNHLRDVPAHLLMESTKVEMMRSRPVIRFFNGEYMGMTQIRDRFDRYHLQHNYGIDPDNVIILNGPNTPVNVGRLDEGVPEDLPLYNDMWHFVVNNDMRLSENYAQLQTMLDIDSYIDLQIVFIYLNNWDWQGQKHFRMWRVRETSNKPYQDGRWRAHAWDFDASPRAGIPGNVFADFDFDLMINAIHPTGGGNGWTHGSADRTLFLRTLLQNETFYNRFLNRFADHINTSFHPDRVKSVATQEYNKIADDNADFRNSYHRDAGPSSTYNDWLQFADLRPMYVRQQIQTHFNLSGQAQVQLDISNSDHGFIRLNTVEINQATPGVPDTAYPWTGTYFQGVPIEVEAIAKPGYLFSHWEGLPNGTPSRTTVPLSSDVSLIAHFVEAPPLHLLHYWHFNAPDAPLVPAFTQGAGHLDILTGADVEVEYNLGGEFFGDNIRMQDETGHHLRINNPLNATVLLSLPTTGHSHIALQYETRRSGQGAGTQQIAYSLDGEAFTPFIEITVLDNTPVTHRIDFTDVPGANNNPDFAVRITFTEGNGGEAGNNRFDNITVEGYPIENVDLPPVLVLESGLLPLYESIEPFYMSLQDIILAQEGTTPVNSFSIENTLLLDAEIANGNIYFYPELIGVTWLNITVNDGQHPPAMLRARVLIYPAPAPLQQRGFVFNNWSADAPEGTYPRHMMFLQHQGSDSQLNTPLLHPYFIPDEDYHNDDAVSIGFPYNNTRRTRINGLNEDGISFINTGRDRDLGGALLALDTRGMTDIPLQWLAGTVLPNDRVYALRLQYRVGMDGPWEDVLDEFDNPIEYVRNDLPDHEESFGPIMLPEACEDQPYVQLLWRYYHVSVNSGPRAELRLDNIRVGAVGHAADLDGDGVISLGDLLRVVQLYNAGEYHCAPPALETGDGYDTGIGNRECAPHSSDYAPQNWRIELPELMRVVQLYNARGYVLCETLGLESEDGFCLLE